jgi:hypothetical protein
MKGWLLEYCTECAYSDLSVVEISAQRSARTLDADGDLPRLHFISFCLAIPWW